MKRRPAALWPRFECSPQAAELSRVGEQELAMLLAKGDAFLPARHHGDVRLPVAAWELALGGVGVGRHFADQYPHRGAGETGKG
jgi:hypothetical protein